jgi:hypothetical protein
VSAHDYHTVPVESLPASCSDSNHTRPPLENLNTAVNCAERHAIVEEVACRLPADIELSVLPAEESVSGVEPEPTCESDTETLHFNWTSDGGEDDEPGGIEGYETLDGMLEDVVVASDSEITHQCSDTQAVPNCGPPK